MNRETMIARMDAILAAAEAEGRGLSTDEQSEFDPLQARIDGLDALQTTRKGLAAVRQQSGSMDRIERAALAPSQPLATLQTRPAGNTARTGDLIKAQLGLGGMQAAQEWGTASAGSSERASIAIARARELPPTLFRRRASEVERIINDGGMPNVPQHAAHIAVLTHECRRITARVDFLRSGGRLN